jgi:hypothetical protein
VIISIVVVVFAALQAQIPAFLVMRFGGGGEDCIVSGGAAGGGSEGEEAKAKRA